MATIATSASAPVLSFHSTTFHPVVRDGHAWLSAVEIAQALGYAREDSVSRIYERNAGEFTAAMTLTVNLAVKGFGSGNSEKSIRIFSLRGAHLIAMFARTERAAEFRRWVLDVLDRETGSSTPTLLNRRWLISYDSTGREKVSPVPIDAFLASFATLTQWIADADSGLTISNTELAGLAAACTERLAQRLSST